jgi:hypothetical protein
MGEMAAGGDMDKQVLKAGDRIMRPYQWGLSSAVVHDVDGDGDKDYFLSPEWHVRDATTGDIDWRYERKKGGAIFRGPALYTMGAKREAGELGNATVDPSPATVRRFNAVAHAAATPRRPPQTPRPLRRASEAPRAAFTSMTSKEPKTPALPQWRSS